MQGNVVKNQISSYEMKKFYDTFLPTNVYTGYNFEGKSNGEKKYLKIIGINPEGQNTITVNADNESYTFDTELYGFVNTADVMCGDYINVDNVENKVSFHKKVHFINMADYVSKITLNKLYDTHTTFQFNTLNAVYEKKPGISNLYCPDIMTHKVSSPTVTNSGIVGIDVSGFVYFKLKADDERYFLNGNRVTKIEQFREWTELNSPKLYYEMKNPIVTDITNTTLGNILLNLKPRKDFNWSLDGGFGELCVYVSIDDALSELKAMVLE